MIQSITIRTTGVAESLLADTLDKDVVLSDAKALMSLAYLPGVDGVDLRVTVRGHEASAAAKILQDAAAAIRSSIGEWIYGAQNDDLAAILLELCRKKHRRIAVAESCTGGLLGARLTAIPGSSDVFVGGVIAYANEVKVRELGVSQRSLDEHGQPR